MASLKLQYQVLFKLGKLNILHTEYFDTYANYKQNHKIKFLLKGACGMKTNSYPNTLEECFRKKISCIVVYSLLIITFTNSEINFKKTLVRTINLKDKVQTIY